MDLMGLVTEFIDDRFESFFELLEMLNFTMKGLVIDNDQNIESSCFCSINSSGRVLFMMHTDWDNIKAKSCRIWNKQKKDIFTGFDGVSIMGYKSAKEARRAMFKALKVEILDALDYEQTYVAMKFNMDSAVVGLQCGWIPCATLQVLDNKTITEIIALDPRN